MEELLVVAGEASGDQHAAGLVAELKRRRPELRFFGMGGDLLAAEGVELLFHAREISVMGIVEVLPKIPRILQVLSALTRAAKERRPKVAILVDVPDFNLRLAKRLKKLGVRVVYYVSPMIWAWRRGRVKQIARDVDRMLCILPFEETFYREAGVAARYVGSPVLEQVPAPAPASEFRQKLGLAETRTLALLPGSRQSEVRKLLPAMVETAKQLSAEAPLQVVVPVAPGISRETVSAAFAGSGVEPVLIDGHAPEVVGASDGAIVASGTATLEAGLMERPFVVVYRVSALSFLVGRLLVKVAHIALVNLLANRRLVPELLQGQMRPDRIAGALRELWSTRQREVVEGLRAVRRSLGTPGASVRAADEVLSVLEGGSATSAGEQLPRAPGHEEPAREPAARG